MSETLSPWATKLCDLRTQYDAVKGVTFHAEFEDFLFCKLLEAEKAVQAVARRFGIGPHLLTASDGAQALCGGLGICPACNRTELVEAAKAVVRHYENVSGKITEAQFGRLARACRDALAAADKEASNGKK